MKAQADQKKQDMETAMLGGEAEPEGMDFGYDYGDEGAEEDPYDVIMMGGNKERKMSQLQVPSGSKGSMRRSNPSGDSQDSQGGNFPLGEMRELSQDEYENHSDSQMFSMVQKQNSSQLMKDNVIWSNTEFMNLDNLPDIIQKLSTRLCKPEDILINRGIESDNIYFLSKGVIEIYIDDPRQGRIEDEYFELESGAIFGEIGVLLNTKRSAYARAQDYSILEVLSKENYRILCQNNHNFQKLLRQKMQGYRDSRTVFIKNLLRYYLYKTHFYRDTGAPDEMKMGDDVDKKSSFVSHQDRNPNFGKNSPDDQADNEMQLKQKVLNQLIDVEQQNVDHNSNEPPVLSKTDEEIITELTYKMQEFFYPQYDLIYNKGDDLDGIIFILEGEVSVTLRSSHSQEFVIDRLTRKCCYGFYGCIKDDEKDGNKFEPKVQHHLVCKTDTVILKLPIDVLNQIRKKSKTLNRILKKESKFLPECDFQTYLTYSRHLTKKQLHIKFKRAVRRSVKLFRYRTAMNKLLNLALFAEGHGGAEGDGHGKEIDFFDEATDIKPIELSQRAQRNLESKLFQLLTSSEILEDVEIISAQSQIQKRKIKNIMEYLRGSSRISSNCRRA